MGPDHRHREVLLPLRGGLITTLRAFLRRLLGLFDRQRIDRELAEELECHLAMQVEANLRSGMTAAEARRAALLKSGGVELAKEEYRDRRGIRILETTLRDLRLICRKRGQAGDAVQFYQQALNENPRPRYSCRRGGPAGSIRFKHCAMNSARRG